jgi:hypothetical protein
LTIEKGWRRIRERKRLLLRNLKRESRYEISIWSIIAAGLGMDVDVAVVESMVKGR